MKGKKMYKERKIYLYKIREKKKYEAIKSVKRKEMVYGLIRKLNTMHKDNIFAMIANQDRFRDTCYGIFHIFPQLLRNKEWKEVVIRFKDEI